MAFFGMFLGMCITVFHSFLIDTFRNLAVVCLETINEGNPVVAAARTDLCLFIPHYQVIIDVLFVVCGILITIVNTVFLVTASSYLEEDEHV